MDHPVFALILLSACAPSTPTPQDEPFTAYLGDADCDVILPGYAYTKTIGVCRQRAPLAVRPVSEGGLDAKDRLHSSLGIDLFRKTNRVWPSIRPPIASVMDTA